MLRIAVLAWIVLAAPARAQDVRIRWRIDNSAEWWRIAEASARWVALERDVCQPSGGCTQEISVRRVDDGTEVVRAPGWSEPIWTDIAGWFSLGVRPWISGDRVLTLRDASSLVALDLPSGRELWRASLPPAQWPTAGTPLEVADDRILVWHEGGVLVLDARTGREAFRLPSGAAQLAGDRIAHFDSRELRTFDRQNGRERGRTPLALPNWPPTYLLANERAIAVLGRRTRIYDRNSLVIAAVRPSIEGESQLLDNLLLTSTRTRLRARSLPSLAPRWIAPPAEFLLRSPHGIVACTRGGTLAMLDPADGRARWRWSLPRCSEHIRYGSRPNVAVAGNAIIARDFDALFALVPGAPSPRTRIVVRGRVSFRGRPMSGVLVQLGDRRIRTDEAGRYQAHLPLRGTLRVWIDEHEVARATALPCVRESEGTISPSMGVQRVDLALRADPYPRDCRRTCRCDH